VKVAVFSLKFKRSRYLTTFRTNREVAYNVFLKRQSNEITGLEMKTNGNYVNEGRSWQFSVLATKREMSMIKVMRSN